MEAIALGIVSIAKAIPAMNAIFQRAMVLYYETEERKDQEEMDEVQQERDMLLATMKQPGITDAQKRVARKRLIALSSR